MYRETITVTYETHFHAGVRCVIQRNPLCDRAIKLREKRDIHRMRVIIRRREGKRVIVQGMRSLRLSVGVHPHYLTRYDRRWLATVKPQGWMP